MVPLPIRSMLGPYLCFAFSLAAACGDDANGSDDAGGTAGDSGTSTAGGGAAGARADAATDAGDGPSADCDDEPIPGFDDVEIFAKCITCHSTELEGDARNDATVGVNFDDYDSAVAASERAVLYVFNEVMPPRQSGIIVTEDEQQQMYQWALCGTPE